MDTQNRTRIIIAYLIMTVVVLGVSYLVEHILLKLPIWYVLILTLLSQIAITFGTFLAIRYGQKKK
jgi:hypothetical protein